MTISEPDVASAVKTAVVSLVSGKFTSLLKGDHRISMVTATLLNAPDSKSESLTVYKSRVQDGIDVSEIQVYIHQSHVNAQDIFRSF